MTSELDEFRSSLKRSKIVIFAIVGFLAFITVLMISFSQRISSEQAFTSMSEASSPNVTYSKAREMIKKMQGAGSTIVQRSEGVSQDKSVLTPPTTYTVPNQGISGSCSGSSTCSPGDASNNPSRTVSCSNGQNFKINYPLYPAPGLTCGVSDTFCQVDPNSAKWVDPNLWAYNICCTQFSPISAPQGCEIFQISSDSGNRYENASWEMQEVEARAWLQAGKQPTCWYRDTDNNGKPEFYCGYCLDNTPLPPR